MARPPSSLPPTSSEPLQVSLILGSFVHTPLKQDLFDIVLPTSQAAPVSAEEASFHLLPEIVHTFREEQKLPPKTISAIFVGVVLSPWAILLGLVRPHFFRYLSKA
jgi:oligosaccharyltransferase complex subunit delta (ribophorin II)